MKKFIALLLILLNISLLSACNISKQGNTNEYTVDYGSSDLYSKQDMDSAIQKIIDEFSTWDGCVMYSIEYTNDDRCKEEVKYCNTVEEGQDFDECIIFNSTFRSPVNGGGAWEPNETYSGWRWYLARKDKGPWVMVTWGYG